MRGTILGVHEGFGVLMSSDDRRMEFPLAEWRSPGTPAAGQVVDFVEQEGKAHAVFVVPGSAALPPPAQSSAFVLACVAVGCLALGFIVPLIPTIAAFVLGVIASGQARSIADENALLLARIAWIGAVVLLVLGLIAMFAAFMLIGTLGMAALWGGS